MDPGPDEDRIHDAFRFDETEDWYEFEGIAAAGTALTPRVQVRVRIPVRHLSPLQALRLANTINGHGACSVHVDEAAGVLLVQDACVFTGYHEAPADAEPGIRRARNEAAVNMFAAVLAVVAACVQARDALAPS